MYSQLLEDKPASSKQAIPAPRASGNSVLCAPAWLFAGMFSQQLKDKPASSKQAKKRQAKKKHSMQLQSEAYFEDKYAAAKKLLEDAAAKKLLSNKASMQTQTAVQTAIQDTAAQTAQKNSFIKITSILQPKNAGLITESFIQDRCLPALTSVPVRTQRQTPLSAPSSSNTTSAECECPVRLILPSQCPDQCLLALISHSRDSPSSPPRTSRDSPSSASRTSRDSPSSAPRTSVPFRTQHQVPPLSATSSSGTTSGSPSPSAPQRATTTVLLESSGDHLLIQQRRDATTVSPTQPVPSHQAQPVPRTLQPGALS
jgi:hypothetical protein